MTDYKRGKVKVEVWAQHWKDVAEMANRNTTIEAKIIEYGANIRKAFHTPSEPNVLIMSPWIKDVHRIIMELPVPQREALIIWQFGDEDERIEMFGRKDREPNKIKGLYKKIGRRIRNTFG